MAPVKGAARSGAYHHGDLRAALVRSATALIAERGVKGFSLTEAARRAGVSVAAPYRHFPDREALLAAVATEGSAELERRSRAVLARAKDPLGRLAALGAGYVRFALDRPAHYRVMFGAEREIERFPELAARARGLLGVLGEAIVVAQRAGTLPPGDPRAIVAPLWALVHGIALLAIDGLFEQMTLGIDAEVLTRRAVSTFLRGLAAPPPRDARATQRRVAR